MYCLKIRAQDYNCLGFQTEATETLDPFRYITIYRLYCRLHELAAGCTFILRVAKTLLKTPVRLLATV